ncbi:MAG TPA: cytochrome c maturation protein CcmE, partial [Pelagibacteraceae bacterium]|nr:cytochrome c maturation protein CcmE [Pelagibacteraceae bacterium]
FAILKSLEENVVYFLSPTEIYNKANISFNKKIRVGGLVKMNSIKKNETSINFIITDLKKEIIVSYRGLVPNLFSEGKGVVAEGKLKDKKYFVADKILAKHDENYMPPEVNRALKKSNN